MRFTFYLPTKIIFGSGSLARLGSEARKIGRKAILVTGSTSMHKTGVLDNVLKDLRANGVETLVFDKVQPNPRALTIDEGARLARSQGVDLVIGLGGGSAMDTAKGIALASSGTEPIWNHIEAEIEVKGPVSPLILVPTIAASGSEANHIALITNPETHEKRPLFSPYFLAKVSIVDPVLTFTVPEKPTAQGGVDIFCHLAELYLTTQKPSALTDGILGTSMRLVVDSLPQALTKLDDSEARTQLSWVSTIATSQIVELGGGAGRLTLHGIEHPLSGYYDIAHGDGLAALLPAWMRFTFPANVARFHSLGRNVFGEEDGIRATERWLEKVSMGLRLRNLGIEIERFEEMAACAVRTAPWLEYHPRVLDATAIAQIYRNAY